MILKDQIINCTKISTSIAVVIGVILIAQPPFIFGHIAAVSGIANNGRNFGIGIAIVTAIMSGLQVPVNKYLKDVNVNCIVIVTAFIGLILSLIYAPCGNVSESFIFGTKEATRNVILYSLLSAFIGMYKNCKQTAAVVKLTYFTFFRFHRIVFVNLGNAN